MAKQRRKFDTSLRLEIVHMVKEQGLSVRHVSESMSIGPTAFRRSRNQRCNTIYPKPDNNLRISVTVNPRSVCVRTFPKLAVFRFRAIMASSGPSETNTRS